MADVKRFTTLKARLYPNEAQAELSRKLNCGNAAKDGYGAFREWLRYKLERQGKALIAVDRYVPSTRTCSACGTVRDAVSYKENTWRCPECGAVHNREINAAKNIKAQGLAQYIEASERR